MICTCCKQEKNESEFYKYPKTNSKGEEYIYINPKCKQCQITRTQNYRKENPDKYKLALEKDAIRPGKREADRANGERQRKEGYQAKWRKEHPEQCREYIKDKTLHRTHNITKKDWNKCKEFFDNKCAYCGLPIEKHYNMFKGKLTLFDFCKDHKDHNGSNDISNCIPACKSCNCRKWKYDMEEWFRRQKFFNEIKLDKINQWIYLNETI